MANKIAANPADLIPSMMATLQPHLTGNMDRASPAFMREPRTLPNRPLESAAKRAIK